MLKVKVENMVSSRGSYVPHQFIITDDKGREIFQSYKTTIAIFDHGKNNTRYQGIRL